MKLLITGASGFVGHRLVQISLSRGYGVVGTSKSGHDKRIISLTHNNNMSFEQVDLTDYNSTEDILNRRCPDAVIHTAGQVSHTIDDSDPILFFKNNALTALNIASAAAKLGVKYLVFISTAHVYKTPPVYLPIDEEHPVEPLNHYGVSKLAAELYCKKFALGNKMSVTILRCPGIYGAGQPKAGAIPKFIDHCLRGETVYLESGGEQTSDFVWVDDVVNASLLALEFNTPSYRLFNIGSGVELSIKELVEIIRSLCSSNSKVNVSGKTSPFDFRFSLNINKAKEQLNYAPCHPEKALKYYIRQWIEEKR